jgi:hypothetical protein
MPPQLACSALRACRRVVGVPVMVISHRWWLAGHRRGPRFPSRVLGFPTSFGAASEISDVAIPTKPLRPTLHAIVSLFFNTAVLALSINLAASMI